MPEGIRATVEFADPPGCPVARTAARGETTIDAVATNVPPADCDRSVTEFVADAAVDPDDAVSGIFSHGDTDRFRFDHDAGVDCPCECLGTFGCAIERYVAREGQLTLVFHAADYEELRAVVSALRERFPDVDVKRFVRSPAGDPEGESVFVDRSKLTARQLEVLETAYEMGYFERPRQANATEVAEAVGISPSTFGEHLAAAQAKLLEDLL